MQKAKQIERVDEANDNWTHFFFSSLMLRVVKKIVTNPMKGGKKTMEGLKKDLDL